MSNEPTDGGENFLSRWSRRKVAAKDEPDAAKPAGIAAETSAPTSSIGAPSGAVMPETPHPGPGLPAGDESNAALPPVESLSPEADFTPFMARDVDPALRNQAMKKLFADPHYGFDNMDKLDIYIDDYSKSEPIPPDVLKKMYQSKSLFLFEDEEKEAAASAMREATPDAIAPAQPAITGAVAATDGDTHKNVVGNTGDPRVSLPDTVPGNPGSKQ